MGKASSKKKVARAAKAGGSRARAAGERNLLFPSALVLVVILGTLLIVYARENRSAVAQQQQPVANEDHWHAAYGIYICDHFLPDLPEFEAPLNGGIHSHGDGLVHIHPFSNARAGKNATLANWFRDAGTVLGGDGTITDDSLSLPGGDTYAEGTDTCEGVDGDPIVQVLYWPSARDGGDPIVFTENFSDIRFRSDGEGFVIAFAPEGADIPVPPSASELDNVSDVDPYTSESTSTTADTTESSDTSEPSDTTTTTTP